MGARPKIKSAAPLLAQAISSPGNGRNGINITDIDLGGTGGNNTLQSNLIGTDATGTAALGNNENGIRIQNRAENGGGGTTAGAGNVLSGNAFGIQLAGPSAVGNQIQGNRIGTDSTGGRFLSQGLAERVLNASGSL